MCICEYDSISIIQEAKTLGRCSFSAALPHVYRVQTQTRKSKLTIVARAYVNPKACTSRALSPRKATWRRAAFY